jgi:hypothetical protein
MSYVLVWPSDIGPCRLEVSERFFAARARLDLHCEHGDKVLRYPPPAWTRVVERRAERSLLVDWLVGFSVLFTLACALGVACWGFFELREILFGLPVPALRQAMLIV